MKCRKTIVSVASLMLAFAPAWAIDSGFQDYSSGYYTRGLETAVYMDQGSGVIDPFYVPVKDWSLSPRITLTVTWDDNLYLDNDDPQRAELIDVIPGALLIYGNPSQNYIYLDAGVNYSAYDSSKSLENKANYLLTLGTVYRTGKTTLSGSAGYRRAETADTVVGKRIVADDFIVDAGIEHQLTAKSSGAVALSSEFNQYEDPELNDYERQTASLRLFNKVTEASDVYGELGFGRDDIDTAEGHEGDASFTEASVGFRGKQSAKLTVSGAAGYQWRTFQEGDQEDVEHWTSTLGANYNPFGFTTIYGGVGSSLTPAINSLGQTTVDIRYTLGLNRRLFTDRFTGNASVFYGMYDYLGTATGDAAVNNNRQDDYFGYNLGLDYYTVHNLSLGLTFSYFENEGNQNADAEGRDRTAYDSGRWVLRASWNY